MNKITAAIDSLKMSNSTIQYGVQLAKQNNAHLVGIFLDDFSHTGYTIYDLIKADGGLVGSEKRKLDNKDIKTRAMAAARFESACREAAIPFTIHHDKGYAIQELLKESIFSDLLILDVRETLQRHPQKPPTDFTRNLLAKVRCPVLIVPHVHKPISKLIYLYDGEPSSVNAFKMFSYTLPDLLKLPTEIVYVNQTDDGNHLPDDHLFKEFVKRHAPATSYTILQGNPKSEILEFLTKQAESSLVILGAYHRNLVSRWLNPSAADVLMKELKLPLFIAH